MGTKFYHRYYLPIEKGFICEGESMTQQNLAEMYDVEKMLEKYSETGYINPNVLQDKTPLFGDVSGVNDYFEAVRLIEEAEKAFMDINPKTRMIFENDPVKMVEFLRDERNDEKAYELGLKNPPEGWKKKEPEKVVTKEVT